MSWKKVIAGSESLKLKPILGLPPCVRCHKNDAYVPSEEYGQTKRYLIDDDPDDPRKDTLEMYSTLAYCGNCYKSSEDAKGFYTVGFNPETSHYEQADKMLKQLRYQTKLQKIKDFWQSLDRAVE